MKFNIVKEMLLAMPAGTGDALGKKESKGWRRQGQHLVNRVETGNNAVVLKLDPISNKMSLKPPDGKILEINTWFMHLLNGLIEFAREETNGGPPRLALAKLAANGDGDIKTVRENLEHVFPNGIPLFGRKHPWSLKPVKGGLELTLKGGDG